MEIKKVYDDYKSLIDKKIIVQGGMRRHRN